MDTFELKSLKMCIFPLLRIPRKNTKHPKNGLKMPKMSLDECIHGCILNQYSLLIYAFLSLFAGRYCLLSFDKDCISSCHGHIKIQLPDTENIMTISIFLAILTVFSLPKSKFILPYTRDLSLDRETERKKYLEN